jgi:4-carboxymuconolactone decarboxylase
MHDLPLGQICRLARISAVVALRREPLLRAELQEALDDGVSVETLREAILQTYLFAGYASTINAFIVLNDLGVKGSYLREGEPSLEEWEHRGRDLCRRIYGKHYEKLMENMQQLHPDLAEWMIWEGYGKVLSRPFLSPRVRELLIVAMTAVLQVERQFHSHVKGALHVGASREELHRVFREVVPWMDPATADHFLSFLP